ncbi:MAG: thiosulfate oxidation carrier protein SoxY [Pseudomonadota bacterium]
MKKNLKPSRSVCYSRRSFQQKSLQLVLAAHIPWSSFSAKADDTSTSWQEDTTLLKITSPKQRKVLVNIYGNASIKPGKVKLSIPTLAENGHSVALDAWVEHPMETQNFVKNLQIFTEKNPLPQVAKFTFTPQVAKASVSTRIRLADTQHILAITELSDGSFWYDTTKTIVTLAACADPYL